MFSVKNRSNIRQVTPYGEFGAFESKTFYPVSKIYANARAFFIQKPQFETFDNLLPVEPAKAPVAKVDPPKPVDPPAAPTEEKLKQEEVVAPSTEKVDEVVPAEVPVVEKKPKGKRSF